MMTAFVALAALGSSHGWRRPDLPGLRRSPQLIASRQSMDARSSAKPSTALESPQLASPRALNGVPETPVIGQDHEQVPLANIAPSLPALKQGSYPASVPSVLSVTPVSAQPSLGWSTQGYLDGLTSSSASYALPPGPPGRSLSLTTDKVAQVLLTGCGRSGMRTAPLTIQITDASCSLELSLSGTQSISFTISTQAKT
ncbi:MAG: hypothetical protein WCJ28_02680 [Actinomycetota bacterium]